MGDITLLRSFRASLAQGALVARSEGVLAGMEVVERLGAEPELSRRWETSRDGDRWSEVL